MGRRRKQRILYFEFPRCNFDVHASVVFCSLPTISVILFCHTISILYDHTSVYEKPTNNHRSALRHKGGDWPIFQLPCPHTIKEGTPVLLDSGLDGKWWADSMECYCYVGKYARPPGRWEDTLWKAVRSTTCWPGYSVWSDGRILLYFW